MSVEVLYVLRKDAPDFQDLDAVVLLAPAVSDDGTTIPAGTRGTVVGIWAEERSCIVEFAEPDGALATVPSTDLMYATPPAEE